ncbi:ABC transporter permease subunit [Metabacillus fastidiosus]|uniref:ABC transporter permease subunit n=1 Tax=Metabacillus fastidiosus TaxID=1458 RepID=UPI002E245B86|nr:ABC transporter permease subunit [Metabacillus fastidiosus]MED4533506.1 ABC transporter permease subunit [Metabacillus fastidiosus]
MVAGELFVKEIKQNAVPILLAFLFISLTIPVRFVLGYMNYKNMDELVNGSVNRSPLSDYIMFESIAFVILMSFFVISLAINQLGAERSKGTMEFTLSLPFSRTKIYFTKWVIGVFIILSANIISIASTRLIMFAIDLEIEHYFDKYFYLISMLLMIYTITFAAGALTGTPFAQGLVTLTVLILPYILMILIIIHIGVFYDPSGEIIEDIFQFFVTNVYGENEDKFPALKLIFPLIMTVITYFIGHFSFKKHPIERNGYFFIWKYLNLPVQLIVIFVGILGFGAFGSYTNSDPVVGYMIGGFFGALLGLLLGYLLIYKKGKGDGK